MPKMNQGKHYNCGGMHIHVTKIVLYNCPPPPHKHDGPPLLNAFCNSRRSAVSCRVGVQWETVVESDSDTCTCSSRQSKTFLSMLKAILTLGTQREAEKNTEVEFAEKVVFNTHAATRSPSI